MWLFHQQVQLLADGNQWTLWGKVVLLCSTIGSKLMLGLHLKSLLQQLDILSTCNSWNVSKMCSLCVYAHNSHLYIRLDYLEKSPYTQINMVLFYRKSIQSKILVLPTIHQIDMYNLWCRFFLIFKPIRSGSEHSILNILFANESIEIVKISNTVDINEVRDETSSESIETQCFFRKISTILTVDIRIVKFRYSTYFLNFTLSCQSY